jgi:hypothetical protein
VVIPVTPLEPAPAFAVFSEVASLVAPDALSPPHTDALVEQLLASLDGHPRALVRAAESLRLQAIEGLLQSVQSPEEGLLPQFLVPVVRGLMETLELEPTTRQIVGSLCAFANSFSVSAYEEVTGDSDLEPLHDLLALGLLRRTGDRYTLSPILRWVSRPSELARARFIQHYLGRAAHLDAEDRPLLLEACRRGLQAGSVQSVARAIAEGWGVLSSPPDAAVEDLVDDVLERLECTVSVRAPVLRCAALLHGAKGNAAVSELLMASL